MYLLLVSCPSMLLNTLVAVYFSSIVCVLACSTAILKFLNIVLHHFVALIIVNTLHSVYSVHTASLDSLVPNAFWEVVWPQAWVNVVGIAVFKSGSILPQLTAFQVCCIGARVRPANRMLSKVLHLANLNSWSDEVIETSRSSESFSIRL